MSSWAGKSGFRGAIERLVARIGRLRHQRGPALAVVLLRILLGFAFLPAGLKKLIGEPFTDPANAGAFHEFLHAFLATGGFYRFVGAVQLLASLLLMTQWFAFLGALLFLPVLVAILVFCWATGVVPTAVVVTLMCGALALLLLWEAPRLLFSVEGQWLAPREKPDPVDLRVWSVAGLAVWLLFPLLSALGGEIYRPRGLDFAEPGFWITPGLVLVLVIAAGIERAIRR